MDKKAGVYKITLGNGFFYIGSSTQLGVREYTHRRSLKLGEHMNALIQKNYDKYKTFNFQVMLYCDKEDVLFYEQRALDVFFGTPGCANLTPKAYNTLGLKWTEEQKAKHCLTMSSLSNEIKEKMRQAVIESNKKRTGTKNKPQSQETKDKISLAKINKRNSHCKNGHEMTDENCLWEKRGPNRLKRLCKMCRKEYERNWYLKKKEKINGKN